MSFSFLFEMTWKSLLITGAALMVVSMLRGRSPADRAAVLRLAVALLLALPVIALALPALPVEMAPEAEQPLPFEALLAMASAPSPVEIAPLEPVPVTIWDDPSSLIAILYLGGFAMVAFRIGAGLLTLRAWTGRAEPVLDPQWLAAFARVRPVSGAGADARLLVSDDTPSPLSWGLRRPAILIDRDTLNRAEDAAAILAHEVAHLVRRDWLALMMTRLSVALFWFNPLVWLLEREVVQQAEEAADTAALGCIEPAHYAQTLVSCAQASRGAPLPANSISPLQGGLGRRVSAILDGRNGRARSGSLWTLAAMLGCTAFAAPLAAVELVPALAAAVKSPAIAHAPVTPFAPLAPLAPLAAVEAAAPGPPAAPAPLAAAPAPEAPAAPVPLTEGEITVPAFDVDVPEQVIHVPEVRVNEGGVRVQVPAMTVRAPRVRVQVPAIRVRVPHVAAPPAPMALAHAAAAAHPHLSPEDRAELERDLREAQEEVQRATAEARAEAAEARAEALAEARASQAEARDARREAERARRESHRAVARAHAETRRNLHRVKIDMGHGAAGMERGAAGMEQGARHMQEEADRLQDPAYRERQIARARADGRTVTHRELLDAIPKLREGSRKMLAGAQNMRESAARMRRSGE